MKLLPLLMLACSFNVYATPIENFGEPQTTVLISAIQNKKLHVVQLGDSHTAADVMTDAMRTHLQQQLGQGGLGWSMPLYISGQRLSQYGYDNTGWQATSSRTQLNGNYTLGGFLATPQYAGATLTIKSRQTAPPQNMVVSIRQDENDQPLQLTDANQQHIQLSAPLKNNTWQFIKFKAQLPITVQAQQDTQTAIGGWWALQPTGATVSALGINGAELSYWQRWQWQKEFSEIAPQLVILAYGTNEAYNNHDIGTAKNTLIDTINQIRIASPHTAILVFSAPESLKNTRGECGTRPTSLSAFQQMQQQTAQQMHTLFWNWQDAMGGECTMKTWMNNGLARQDGIHFTAAGYQKLGQNLAQALLELSHKNDF